MRATAGLLASLDPTLLVELRASAPTVAELLDGLRVGPARDAWIRELVRHACAAIDQSELDRAAARMDREQGGRLGLVLALAA